MKAKIILLTTLVTATLFATITGCKRHDDDYYYYGDVTFWNDDLNEDIRVTIDGRTDDITVNNYTSFCGQSGRANFNLPEGTYHYYASSRNYTWDNYVYVAGGQCKLVEL